MDVVGSAMNCVAALGVGSTNLRYAAANTRGEFLTDVTVEPMQPRAFESQLLESIGELQAASTPPLDAVAVTTPGLVDRAAGVVHDLDASDGDVIDRVPVREPIERRYDLPVYVENDCNASALGEWYFGSRTDHASVAHVTFGTGIGGGVVEEGELVRGESAQAGEFGLVSVAPDADLASTGVTGAWEAFCSGRGIPRYVAHQLSAQESADSERLTALVQSDDLTAADVFRIARRGDQFAQTCLERIARYNAVGIGTICNAFNPSLITLGGSVALNNRDWLVDGIEGNLDDYLFVDRPEIRFSTLEENIGLYGALAAVLERTSRPRSVSKPNLTRSSDE